MFNYPPSIINNVVNKITCFFIGWLCWKLKLIWLFCWLSRIFMRKFSIFNTINFPILTDIFFSLILLIVVNLVLSINHKHMKCYKFYKLVTNGFSIIVFISIQIFWKHYLHILQMTIRFDYSFCCCVKWGKSQFITIKPLQRLMNWNQRVDELVKVCAEGNRVW